jgi:hypothetical protein
MDRMVPPKLVILDAFVLRVVLFVKLLENLKRLFEVGRFRGLLLIKLKLFPGIFLIIECERNLFVLTRY